jgi:hypothetical protein
MKDNTLIKTAAFVVIFLSALFLFIRNYPSDRWFSVVFIAASGVLAWNAEAEAEAEAETVSTGSVEPEAKPEAKQQ